ncbi:hypothetical protein Patl1_36238 [Pistacia atlantica]|nr:hypothetical protein Patl1_36238 [Pistacia atlantica]
MGEVDPAFIQAPEHRPKLSVIEAQGIPLIDLSVLNSPDDTINDDALVAEMGNACKKWGFFQVINHGVPLEKRQRIEEAARKFFAQPLEEKRKVRRDKEKVLGYYDTEHTKNVRDWKEVFDLTVHDPTFIPASLDPDDEEIDEWHNQWPEYPPELREACEEYAKEMEKASSKIKLPSLDSITTRLAPPLNLALGLGRHTDAGALTILAQDNVEGLEVKRKSDGEWIRVWSNEAYESVEHRVMANSERERFSIPYFLIPAHYTIVKPLDELTNELNPAKYRAYNWGKFFTTRKLSNFKKLSVENIQISHFKIQELSNKLEGGLTIT